MEHAIPDRLVVATHNAGKLREFSDLLRPYIRDIVSSGDLKLDAPEETGTTFAENALIKAKAAALASGRPALADDSGLCINALNGEPGIYSARWAEPHNDFVAAMKKINERLGDSSDRSAYFACVLTLCWPDGASFSVEGRVDGVLARTPRGQNGHGYDPIFIPDGSTQTFAEMDDTEKNRISHRSRALAALVDHLVVHRNSF